MSHDVTLTNRGNRRVAIRLAIYMLSKRWGWLAVGAIVLVIGVFVFARAHVTQPVKIDGTISDYKEYTGSDGAYHRNELQLSGDSHAYVIIKTDFHPTLPDRFPGDRSVTIWVDQGTTSVVAVALYDDNLNPTKYTTDAYDHPERSLQNDHLGGEITAGIGGLLLLFGLAWPILPWGRKKVAPQPVAAAAGVRQSAYDQSPYGPAGAPVQNPYAQGAYGQNPYGQPASAGQNPYEQQAPGYGQQPGAGWGQPPSPYRQPGPHSGGQAGPQGGWGGPPQR